MAEKPDETKAKRQVWLRGREFRQAAVLELMGVKFGALIRRGIDAIWMDHFGEEDIAEIEATGKARVDRVYEAMTQDGPGAE